VVRLLTDVAPTSNLISAVLQYGIVGVVAIVLFFVAKRLFDREQARADRLEADVRRLNDLMAEQLIPALTKSTSAVLDAQQLINDIRRAREIEDAARRLREQRG
jgi:hypothetical protein